ncbi:hypothetical protein ACS0TY_027721 [Phlomoides rotata]
MNHGITFAFDTELATALYAIRVAYDSDWRNIWLDCDSIYVVQLLRATDPEIPWRLLARWHEISCQSYNDFN